MKRSATFQEGTIHQTRYNGSIVITKYVSSSEVYVRFIDTGYETVTRTQKIKDGSIRDRFRPSVVGVGINDFEGEVNTRDGIIASYSSWRNMLIRCYDEKYQSKYPTYKGCSVCKEWYRFSVFKEWFDNNSVDGWELDKDIKVKGNKVYSPETCVFVPSHVNSMMFGYYNEDVGCLEDTGLFRVRVCVFNPENGTVKRKHIGRYKSKDEAFLSYKTNKKEHLIQCINWYIDNSKNKNLIQALKLLKERIDSE